jgi:uncharacterized membrane protein
VAGILLLCATGLLLVAFLALLLLALSLVLEDSTRKRKAQQKALCMLIHQFGEHGLDSSPLQDALLKTL